MFAISEEEFQRRLNLPIDQILEALGREVYQPPLGALLPRAAEYVSAAKIWLESRRLAICRALCANAEVKNYMEGKALYNNAQIAAIIFDLVSLANKAPLAGAGWASVALIHLGLVQFCDNCDVAE